MIPAADDNKIKFVYNFWKEAIPEIKKQSFEREQCFNIKRRFIAQLIFDDVTDVNFFRDYRFDVLSTELDIALEIAYSNYRKEKRSFWSSIFRSAAKALPDLKKTT
jgi:hypothetical protein